MGAIMILQRFKDRVYQIIKDPFASRELFSFFDPDLQLKVRWIHQFGPKYVQVTGRALDIEIQGKGFFVIQQPDGQMAYTRKGCFRKNSKGYLEDNQGGLLVPEVMIPLEAHSVQINPSGRVSYICSKYKIPKEVGQIKLVDFCNPSGLRSIGHNLYRSSLESGPPYRCVLGTLVQGQLRSIIADSVLMELHRLYQHQ